MEDLGGEPNLYIEAGLDYQVIAEDQPDYLNLAIAYFTEALRLDSGSADAYFNRGSAFLDAGEAQKSLSDFNSALEIDPEHYNALMDRAFVHAQLAEFELALADVDAAITLRPDCFDAYFNRGNVYGELGEYSKAVRDFTTALTLDSDATEKCPVQSARADAYYNRGVNRYWDRDYEQALVDFDAALDLDPENPRALLNRGLVHMLLGEDQIARNDLEAAHRHTSNHATQRRIESALNILDAP